MNNRPLRTDHVDLLRGMLVERAQDLPQILPPEHRMELENSDEVKRIEDRLHEIGGQLPLLSNQATLLNERKRLYRRKCSLKKKALTSLQRSWHNINYDEEVRQQLLNSAFHIDPKPESRFSILSPFLLERSRLAETLFSPKSGRLSDGEILNDLTSLCIKSEPVLYRPGERPIQGRCPFNKCYKPMES